MSIHFFALAVILSHPIIDTRRSGNDKDSQYEQTAENDDYDDFFQQQQQLQ
jgi:hypothetical protein